MSAESLQILISAIDNASSPIRQVAESIEGLARTGNQIQNIGQGMTNLGRQMTVGVTAPIVGGLALATNAAIQFESSLAATNKALGASPNTDAAREIREEVSALAIELGAMPTAVAGMYTEAGKLGVLRDQMEAYVTSVNQASVAWDMTGDAAAESVSKLTNVLGYQDAQGRVNIEGLNRLGDVINYLADSGATSEAAIANVLGRAGGTTRSFGLASESAAGLAAGFLNLGDAPEVVATALNGMLPMLQNSTRQTAKFQAGLEELGLSAEQMEGMIKEDAAGAFQELIKRLHETENASGVIADMFGSGSDSAMLSKAAQNYEAFVKTMNSASSVESGGMGASFENQMQTTQAQLGVLQAQMFLVGANIGSAILPALNEVIAAIQPLISGFAKFAAENQDIVKIGVAIAGVVAAIGPLLVIIGSIVSAVGTITGAIAGIQAFGVAIAAMMAGAAPAAGLAGAVATALGAIAGIGLGPIIAAIAAIAAGAYLIIQNWQPISEFFSSLWTEMIAAIQPALPAIQQMGAAMAAGFGSFLTALQSVGAAFMQMIGFVQTIAASLGPIPQILFAVFMPIPALLMAAGNAFMGFIANLNSAASAATSFGGVVGAAIGSVIAAILRIGAAAAQAAAAFASALQGMVSAVSAVAGQMFAAGARIVQQLAAGIRSGIGAVTSAIGSVTAAAARFLPGSPVKEGALTVVNSGGAGLQIMQMLASGFSASPLTGAMQSALSPLAGMLPTAGAGLATTGAGISPTVGTTAATNGGGNFMITLNVNASEGADGDRIGSQIVSKLREEFPGLIADYERNRQRVSYGTA